LVSIGAVFNLFLADFRHSFAALGVLLGGPLRHCIFWALKKTETATAVNKSNDARNRKGERKGPQWFKRICLRENRVYLAP
jgi:hypothetical protein